MLKNNKGFMLIEVIVTSTIVLTSMIALYISFNKLYNNYNVKNSYYNLDVTYATKKIIDSMINEKSINKLLNNNINDYKYIIKENQCIKIEEKYLTFNCETIKEFYKVDNMILLKYNLDSFNNLLNNNLTVTFKDYIEYVKKMYDISNSEEYNYIILTEVKQNKKYYYSNLKLR